SICDAVSRAQRRRARSPIRKGGDLELEPSGVAARDRRNRQVAVRECVRLLRAAPAEELAARPEERLQRKAAAPRLQRSVLVQEPLIAAAVDPDESPVELLPRKRPRPRATRRAACDGLQARR